MKLYEVIKYSQRINNEILDLKDRFINNNCIRDGEFSNYDCKILLDDINKLTKKSSHIEFLIKRYELNISELKNENKLYDEIIDMLKRTITSSNLSYKNIYSRVELDKLIDFYTNEKIKNVESIDYYYFVTDVDIES